MSVIKLVAGNTNVTISDSLTKDSVATNLTGATVLFVIQKGSGYYTKEATIGNPALGEVSIQVDDTFPTTLGAYEQQWEVTFADQSILHFPSNSKNTLFIAAPASDSTEIPLDSISGKTRIYNGVLQLRDENGIWHDIELKNLMGEVVLSIGD